eukprot:Em0007g169a
MKHLSLLQFRQLFLQLSLLMFLQLSLLPLLQLSLLLLLQLSLLLFLQLSLLLFLQLSLLLFQLMSHHEGIAGRAKVSAVAVVVRLTEEYLAGKIRLAELPVVGQVRTSYQSIGQSKDEASKSPRKKTGCDKPQRKKQKTSNTTFDWSKPLLKWSKPQLQTYLARHNLCTSGNKPELIERLQACMNTNPKLMCLLSCNLRMCSGY